MTIDRLPLSPFTLRLLGVPDLRDADGVPVEPIAAQPKRMALLVRLALAGDDGISRQSLITLLWPELDDTHARNALRQSLHFLRRHLGAPAVRTTDERVALDAAHVACDTRQVEELLERGDNEAALARCAGRLADGLHVAGSAAFADWLDTERRRFARVLAEAAWRLADADEGGGRATEARRWADLAMAIAPDDEASPRRRAALDDRLADAGDAQARHCVAAQHEKALSFPWYQRPAATWGGFAAGVLLVLGSVGVSRLDATPPLVPERVAVLPFVVHGGPELAYLREGMVDLLAARLDGIPGLRVVDARLVLRTAGDVPGTGPDKVPLVATRLAAAHAVTGTIADSAGQLIVEASMFRADGRLEGSARSVAPSERELLGAIDAVARRLIEVRGAGDRDHLRQLAARTTSSLDALRAWLEGEQAFRAGRYVAATDAFQRAVLLDTNFAVAYFRLGLAAAYATAGQSDVSRTALPAALRHGDRLGAHDRLMVEALFDDWHGKGDSAPVLYKRAMAERPDDAEAWFAYADFLFHHGPREGTGLAATRPYFERALALDSGNLSAVVHLGRIAAIEGDHDRLRALALRERALRSAGAVPGEVAWIAAVARGESDTVAAMLEALSSASDEVATDFAWRAASYGGDPAVAVRVLQRRVEGDRPLHVRASNVLALAHFEMQRARPASAARLIDQVRSLAPVSALLAEGSLLWAAAPSPEALQAARFRLSRWRTSAGIGSPLEDHGAANRLAFAASQLDMATQAALGNDELLTRFVAICERQNARIPYEFESARQVDVWGRARHLLLSGDTAGALHLMEQRAHDPYPRGSVVFIAGVAHLERARLLAALGRVDDALQLLSTLPEENGHDAAVLPAVALLRAQLLAWRGDRAGAHREGERLLRMWRDAEPTERGRLDLVRRVMRGEQPRVIVRNGGGSGRVGSGGR